MQVYHSVALNDLVQTNEVLNFGLSARTYFICMISTVKIFNFDSCNVLIILFGSENRSQATGHAANISMHGIILFFYHDKSVVIINTDLRFRLLTL